MTYQLFTDWSDFRAACDQVLRLAERRLCIFDPDLSELGLHHLERFEILHTLALQQAPCSIRIALHRTDHLHRDHPRLIKLLQTHAHVVQVQQIPDSLQHLRDCMILADDRHAVVRFDQAQARCKLILNDPAATAPYQQRFETSWTEVGTPFSPTPLGL